MSAAMASTARWISLTKVGTGFVFSQTHSIRGSQWPFITEAVCHEFECGEDELECQEDDETGAQYVVLNGKRVVQIHDCYLQGCVAIATDTWRTA
jgi:hypothetical protein